jgi:drug/metabolite transporter (DMT)-like permease
MLRLAALVALVMAAFAANSLLNRAAVATGAADAAGFSALRLAAGAAVLQGLCLLRGRALRRHLRQAAFGAGSLTLYMLGFSLAYRSLDAGLGALILFGAVQITMFAWAALRGAAPAPLQWAGAGLAFAGLAFVLWPSGAVQVPPIGAALMAAAGLGWGAYTLAGRGEPDPLGATAGNFLWSAALVCPLVLAAGGLQGLTPHGALLAGVSGAVTSGLGYALWYRVLPRLDASLAATVQLSVPVIALAAGALLLQEAIGMQLILGTLMVLAGIFTVIRAGAR